MRLAPITRVWLLGLALVASACASDPTRRSVRDADELVPPSAEPPSAAPHADAFAAPGSRPRLRHTVTLGESHGEGSLRPSAQRDAPTGDHAPSPPTASPPVVYVYPPAYGYGYGYGDPGWNGGPGWYGWRDVDVRRSAKPRPSPSNPPALGEDWTPPKQTGPRFPFKTAPADPWK